MYGAPPLRSTGPPPMTMASPYAPVPPPSKKQRSTDASASAGESSTAKTPRSGAGPPPPASASQFNADEAIARRRAELRRLQAMVGKADVLNKAQNQLNDPTATGRSSASSASTNGRLSKPPDASGKIAPPQQQQQQRPPFHPAPPPPSAGSTDGTRYLSRGLFSSPEDAADDELLVTPATSGKENQNDLTSPPLARNLAHNFATKEKVRLGRSPERSAASRIQPPKISAAGPPTITPPTMTMGASVPPPVPPLHFANSKPTGAPPPRSIPIKSNGNGNVPKLVPRPAIEVANANAPTKTKKEMLRTMRELADTPLKETANEEKKESPSASHGQNNLHDPVQSPTSQGPQVGTTGKLNDYLTSSPKTVSPTSRENSTAMKLVKELRVATDERANAEQKLADLQKEMEILKRQQRLALAGSKQSSNADGSVLSALLDVAQRKGDKAAVQWAEDMSRDDATVPGSPSPLSLSRQARFAGHSNRESKIRSILTPARDTSPERRAGITSRGVNDPMLRSRRTAAPQPRLKPNSNISESSDIGGIKQQFLLAAARAVTDEYQSENGTYFVRKPYLNELLDDEDSKRTWEANGVLDHLEYKKKADIFSPDTLEIVGVVAGDGSILTLNDASHVRHGRPDADQTIAWTVLGNVEELDKDLGCIMYIDGNGMEKEYLLDEIYEEAIATRETYCSSILSAAAALQTAGAQIDVRNVDKTASHDVLSGESRNQPVSAPKPMDVHAIKVVTSDVCVGTEDMKIPSMVPPKAATVAEKSRPKAEGAPVEEKNKGNVQLEKKKEVQQPVQEEATHDLLSSLLLFIISSMFGLVWFVFVRLPIKIISLTFMLTIISVLLSTLWLYFANDNGASSIGAGIDYSYNRPGIY